MPQFKSLLPVRFAVLHSGEPAEVTLNFANNTDVALTTRWRVPQLADPVMRSRAADSREFALLAAKRWRHYRDIHNTARSIAELQRMIAKDAEGEFCFHLKVTADWFPGSLGGAMVRRTWYHHLALDFLFVHPRISSKLVDVRSVGVQLLQGICVVAHALGCQRVWGETTQDSAPFYRRYLEEPVDDQFTISTAEIARLSASLENVRIG
ncbi:hypothetical protein [Prosthecobacter sp.]|uniref:hypothetical protein n=1 Tax=Prosthecobacter sp. TaxID=1965333 RepID=UPI0037844C48